MTSFSRRNAAGAPRVRRRISSALLMMTVGALAAGVMASAAPGPALAKGQRRPIAPRPGAVPLRSAPPQTVELWLPFDGVWGVIQGFGEPVAGKRDGDQSAAEEASTHVGYATYALDFVPAEIGPKEETLTKKRPRLEDFPCFGKPILAPADGRVVWAHGAARDWPVGKTAKNDPGNFVILEHGDAQYTEFRHLQARSVRVQVGDNVKRGQEIGRCGNSGNAKTPHVHVGFLGSVDPIATRPMNLTHYEILGPGGWKRSEGVPAQGVLLRPLPAARR